MKPVIYMLIGMGLFMTVNCTPKVDIEAEKANVKSTIDQFSQAMGNEDIELLSKIIAHDADMVNFGTDASERWVGWEAFIESVKKQFESFENAKLSVKDLVININKSGQVAWFSDVIDMQGTSQGQSFSLQGTRSTGVLEKRNGKWLIVQIHASVPVSGQAVKY